MCACYGELTAGLDSRLPASCRGNSGEADDAEPEDLDSGPQVLLNLLWIVGSLGWCVAFLVYFLSVLVVVVAAVCRNPSTLHCTSLCSTSSSKLSTFLCGIFAGEVLSLILLTFDVAISSSNKIVSSNLSRRRLPELNQHPLRKCRRLERINCVGVKYFFQTFEHVWVGRYVPTQHSDYLRSQPPQSLRDTALHDF